MNDQTDRPDETTPPQPSGSRWEPATPPVPPEETDTAQHPAVEQTPDQQAVVAPGETREEKRRRVRRIGIAGSVAAAVLLVGGGAGFAIGHASADRGDSDIAELTGFGRNGAGDDRNGAPGGTGPGGVGPGGTTPPGLDGAQPGLDGAQPGLDGAQPGLDGALPDTGSGEVEGQSADQT